jgi:phosphatidyl-myo-inositol dimannoside synthase
MKGGPSFGLRNDVAPRVLTLTPDCAPVPRGIQVLTDRLVRHAERPQTRVVTLAASDPDGYPPAEQLGVHRVKWAPQDRRLPVSLLNVMGVREGLEFRPVALSFHIVMAPAAWAFGIPMLVYLHGDEVSAGPDLTRFAARRCDLIVVVRRHTEAMAVRLGAEPSMISLIPPGVDPLERRLDRRSERRTLVTVARLEDRYKGHDVVLRPLPRVRRLVQDVRWVVIGEGSLRPELERLAAAIGIHDAVVVTGRLSDEVPDLWLDRAHVFVMPSRLPAPSGGDGLQHRLHGRRTAPASGGGRTGRRRPRRGGRGPYGTAGRSHKPKCVRRRDLRTTPGPAAAEALGRAGADHAKEFACPPIAARLKALVLQPALPERFSRSVRRRAQR